MAASYRLTVRAGPRVEHEQFADLDAALAALEERGRALERDAHAKPVGGGLLRRLDPAQQVVARLELRGPHVRAGVDVRGDGSSEAFTGWLRRRLVEQRGGESAYDALKRAVRGQTG